jgi:hypothetical protein
MSRLRDGTVLVWDLNPFRRALKQDGKELGPGDLEALWKTLAGEDARRAHQATWALAATPEKAVPWLANRLRPAPAPDRERIGQLIADLGADQFAVREGAVRDLEQLGDQAVPALRQLLHGKPSLEARRRAEALLAGREVVRSREALRAVRAIQTLERIGSREARVVLEGVAKGAPEARQTQEAKASLERLAKRGAALP